MTRKNEKRKGDMDMEKQKKKRDKKADTGNTLRGAIPSPGIDSRRLFLDWENAAWRDS